MDSCEPWVVEAIEGRVTVGLAAGDGTMVTVSLDADQGRLLALDLTSACRQVTTEAADTQGAERAVVELLGRPRCCTRRPRR